MSDDKNKLSGSAYANKVKSFAADKGKSVARSATNKAKSTARNVIENGLGPEQGNSEITDEGISNAKKALNSPLGQAGQKAGKRAMRKGAQLAKKAAKKLAKQAREMMKKIIKLIIKAVQAIIKLIIALIKAIIAFLIQFWWLVLIVIAVVLVVWVLASVWHFIENLLPSSSGTYQDETVSYSYSDNVEYSISNAIAGAFYSKYSEQSLYVVVSAPEAETDAGYSDMTYEELGGTTDVEILFQYGTDEFEETGVVDIDNYEAQLTLSPGFLSTLDNRMNEGYLYPEQFIKPVYASCVVSGDYSDFSECDLLTDEDDNILTALSVAYSSENNGTGESTIYTKEDGEEMTSVSDWGLGTIAHYQAYYQPSRIYDYGISTVTIWNEDWNPSDGGSPLITLAWDNLTTEEQEEILATYARGAFGVTDTNDDGTYNTGLYDVDSIITYADWNKAVEAAGGVWATIQNYINNVPTTLYGPTNQSLWSSGDPGVSSGVPETEIVYVIDSAVTLYGKVEFTVTQEWVDQGISDHTQYSTYIKVMTGYTVDGTTDIVEDVTDAEGLKAVYDSSGTLLGYMDGSDLAVYEAPYIVEDTSESCQLNEAVCEDEEHDGSWTIQLSYDEDGEETNETIVETVSYADRNRTLFTFVRAYRTEVSALTEGYLQTYMVIHSDVSIDTNSDNAAQYLEDYLSVYEAYIPYDEDNSETYYCYAYSGTITSYSIDEAAEVVLTSSSTGTSYGSPSGCGVDTFAILEDSEGHLMQYFYYEDMPTDQFLKIAALLGYTDDNGEASTETIEVNDVDIEEAIGSNLDTLVNDLWAVYGDLFETYGGAYGIDPDLLALIAAQEYGGICEGDYYNDASDYHYGSCNLMQIEISGSREFEAYNFNMRQTAGEDSTVGTTTFLDVIKALWNSSNRSSLIFEGIGEGSWEEFEVTEEEFANGKNGMSTVEMSIKMAAMYLQNLLDYYEGNLPLAIQAYNFGTGGLDAVLEIYEQQTGTTWAEVVANPYELGWFHYTTEVYTNPSNYIEGWTEGTYGDDEYLTNVLSRLTDASLYYIRTESSAESTDTVQNSIGVWVASNITDSESVYISRILSSSSEADTVRAWRLLKQSDDFERDWSILTLGQKSVDSGIYVVDGVLDVSASAPETAILVRPEKNDTDISMIITTALAFGSDVGYNDITYGSEEFWMAKFSTTLGTAAYDKLNSSLSPEKVFGDVALSYPSNDYETVEEYGVHYYEDATRDRIDHESIMIGESDENIYSVVEGATVVSITQRNDGLYVLTLDASNDDSIFDEVLVIYEGLTTVDIEVGDTVNTVTAIGTAESGTTIDLYLVCDGEYNDLFGVIDVFINKETIQEMIFLTMATSGLTTDDSAVEAGYVPEVSSSKLQEFLDNLLSRRGWGYTYGGKCTTYSGGCDCSSLVYQALTMTGLLDMGNAYRATEMMNYITTPVSADDLQVGDLIYFKYPGSSGSRLDHVAVYMGEIDGVEYIYHAILNGVVYSPFDQITSYGGTWRDYVVGYGRLPLYD